MDGIDQTNAGSDSAIEDVHVLIAALSAIELPAVGDDGVVIAHYPDPMSAVTLHVDWDGNTTQWHASSNAHYVYTAASMQHYVSLLYSMASYAIHEGDDPKDISGSVTSYKEFLSANSQGFAWVDYPGRAIGGPPAPAGESLGELVFQRWAGARSTLTDSARYRARPDLSETQVAFVEYEDTEPGTVGQIVVQAIAGGEPIVVAPSAHHQDRPAIDGDWVVWEEYLSESDSVIRARNLATGEVRDLSTSEGFRTNPDIVGSRVVWEDQRSGDGDIYFIDLDGGDEERVAVSGSGHSTAARLSSDGLVWIEAAGAQISLMRAHWLP